MPSGYRRAKSVDPRLFRTAEWESEMATEVSARDCQHLQYIPPSHSPHRATTAMQTDLSPEWSLPAVQVERGTMTEPRQGRTPEDAALNALRPRSELQRPEPSLRDDPYKNFYRRMAEDLARQKPNLHNGLYKEPGAPVFRSGRLGAPWRHIRQCTGNLGNHICFVDGQQDGSHRSFGARTSRLGPWNHVVQVTGNRGDHIAFINPSGDDGVVKQGDMESYPPYGYNGASDHLQALAYVTPRTAGYTRVQHPMMRSATFAGCDVSPRPHNRNRTSVNHRAKQNFKYWHEEKPYQGLPAKQTISGRLMAKGIGY